MPSPVGQAVEPTANPADSLSVRPARHDSLSAASLTIHRGSTHGPSKYSKLRLTTDKLPLREPGRELEAIVVQFFTHQLLERGEVGIYSFFEAKSLPSLQKCYSPGWPERMPPFGGRQRNRSFRTGKASQLHVVGRNVF